MHCGMRVFLHSLETAVELNQKFAKIVTVERETVVVKMEGTERTVRISKNKVAATWRDLETAQQAATERETAPKAATERETAPKAATERETAPTAATERETAPTAATEREIAPMVWGSAECRRHFYASWRKQIETMDGGAFRQSESNIRVTLATIL